MQQYAAIVWLLCGCQCGSSLWYHTLMLKSFTPQADMNLAKCLKKLRAAIDSSCSSGYSKASMAANSGWFSSSLQQKAPVLVI